MFVAPRSLSSLSDFTALLDACGLAHRRWADDEHGLVLEGCGPRQDTRVYLRWQSVTGLVRLSIPVLDEVAPGRDEDVALAVAAANVDLTVPGFVFDARRGQVYWRAVALITDGTISSERLGALLHLGPRTVQACRSRLEASARPAAGATLDEDSFLFAAL